MGRPPLPKGTARTEWLTVRLTIGEMRQLRTEARRRGLPIGEVLRLVWRKGG